MFFDDGTVGDEGVDNSRPSTIQGIVVNRSAESNDFERHRDLLYVLTLVFQQAITLILRYQIQLMEQAKDLR